MAAGLIYTIGGSFWEFGGPDLDRARLFVMLGTAEDHHSNPLKIAIAKFKRDGGRFVSVNPVRTGYSAIADEWVPIRPGTDGAFLLAVIHEMLAWACTTASSSPATPTAASWSTRTRRATSSACSCAPRCRRKRPATTRRTSCGGTG
jgi:anaerobic selenocysteine-containing dehydrogenase